MEFSVILASRDRVPLLDSLLQSLERNTADKVNTEVIVVVDEDDDITRRFVSRLKRSCSFAKIQLRARTRNLNEDYLNWAWRSFSSGKYVIVCNDDCVFSTPGWDRVASDKLAAYLADKPDGVVYGWISDSLITRAGGSGYCCFPLVSRAAASVLGWVMPPEFPGWGADIGLFRVFEPLGRVCDLSEVRIDHISYHSGKRERDHVSHYVESISAGTVHPFHGYDPEPALRKLVDHIATFKQPSR